MDIEDLPPGWAWARLGEVLPLEYGTALPARIRTPGGTFPVYGSGGVVGMHDTALVAGPTIVVGRKGSAGSVFFSPNDCWPMDTAYYVRALGIFDIRFAYYYLSYLRLERLDQSTAIPSLSRTVYSELTIPIPPLDEQRQIAELIERLFSELDEAEAALKRARDGLAEFRASVLHSACTGELTAAWRAANRPSQTGADLLIHLLEERRAAWERAELIRMEAKGIKTSGNNWKSRYKKPKPLDMAGLPDLPDGWTWATLGQLTAKITSGSRDWGDHYTEKGAVLIRAQNINTDQLDLLKLAHVNPPGNLGEQRTAVHNGDLLITITGANVTKSALVNRELGEAYVSQHVGLCRPVIPFLGPFLHLTVICESLGRRQLKEAAYGAGKPGLNLEDLASLRVTASSNS